MKRLWLIILTVLACSSVGRAQFTLPYENTPLPGFSLSEELKKATNVDILNIINTACSISGGVKYICKTGEIVGMIDGLTKNGLNMIRSTLVGIVKGGVKDFIADQGNLCINPDATGAYDTPSVTYQEENSASNTNCVNGLINTIYKFLQDKPSELLAKLNEVGRGLYFSKVRKMFEPYGPNNPEPTKFSATWWAEHSIRSSPIGAQRALALAEEDLKRQAILNQALAGTVPPPKKEENSSLQTYLDASGAITADDCVTAPQSAVIQAALQGFRNTQPALDAGIVTPTACVVGGGVALDAKNKAKSAVSSREVLQTLVDLQSDAVSNDVSSTLQLTNEIRKLGALQVKTNNQLEAVVKAVMIDKMDSVTKMKAELEQRINEAYTQGQMVQTTMEVAADLYNQATNPASADAILEF